MDQVVGFFRFFQLVAVGDEAGDVELARCQQVGKTLHVAVFCPADVAGGVVSPFSLIIGIVAAGTVGGGHHQFEFFFVVVCSVESRGYGTHHHHPCFLAGYGSGKVHRIEGGGACRDEHRIGAEALGLLLNQIFQPFGIPVKNVGDTGFFRGCHLCLGYVDPQRIHARSFQYFIG